MDSETRQDITQSRGNVLARVFSVPCMTLCVLLGFSHAPIFAQDSETGTHQSPLKSEVSGPDAASPGVDLLPGAVIVKLPDDRQMSWALTDLSTRQRALLDVAAAAHVLDLVDTDINAAIESGVNHQALAQRFLDSRAWLQTLVDRYGWQSPRNSVLDPAAWLVMQELLQHDLVDIALIMPGNVSRPVLMGLVFQRVDERFAVSNLPAFLLAAEADAVSTWQKFYQLTGAPDAVDPAWKAVETTWFAEGVFADSGSGAAVKDEPVTGDDGFAAAMSRQVVSVVDSAPPDSRALQQLRYSMLRYLSSGSAEGPLADKTQARSALYMTALIDGLHDGRYMAFAQGILTITAQMLERPASTQPSFWLVDWLVSELPGISAHYATDFAGEDPRLNAVVEAAFSVLQRIANARDLYTLVDKSDPGAQNKPAEAATVSSLEDVSDELPVMIVPARSSLRRDLIRSSTDILADAAAQLALMIPDMAYYFDTPVRQRIVEEMNICISIAASRDDSGAGVMLRRQFDGCMETFLRMADEDTRTAELAGNVNGPFTADALGRELNVTPWQRINYGIGYLHHRYRPDCQVPANPVPNPLEFAVLANAMAWFAEHAPDFAATPENEARMAKMRDIGEQLILSMTAQLECLAGPGPAIDDPVSRGMTDYELALRELNGGIKRAEEDFRAQRLSPGADVQLEQDASQRTSYRPDNLSIGPCEQESVCEMSGQLSTTRALIGLFPNEYLLAEQTGLGNIEMCYRNLEWVERRSELVRADDENVSNYYGRLGFDLVGRFSQAGNPRDIFAFRFVSPEEHHYLFAQTSQEVLDDGCPMSWVGSRIITPLRENRLGIVPDRLTYLAASRMLPSRLLQNNWDRGAEWRDWFVTGIGVSPIAIADVPDIMIPLNQHLQSLYQAEQAEIYRRILLPDNAGLLGEDLSLFDEIQQVSTAKALLRMQMLLFYPGALVQSDRIRSSIAGDDGLLDNRLLRRFRQDNVPMVTVNASAMNRLNELRSQWNEQPQTVRQKGSVSQSLMNAMVRINALYRRLFVSRPEPLKETEPNVEASEQAAEATAAGRQEDA